VLRQVCKWCKLQNGDSGNIAILMTRYARRDNEMPSAC
jgi:hypothetical protein